MRWREAWARTRGYRTVRARLLWAWRLWTGRYVQPDVYLAAERSPAGPV
jgi:hypothetical protein